MKVIKMKKIYITLATIFFLTITLTISGVAWFNISNISLIDDIALKAGSGDLLELSLDGQTFNKTLDEKVIKEKLKKLKFKDITTQDGFNFFKNPYQTETQRATPNIDYISIEVWFRVTAQAEDQKDKHVFLANGKNHAYEIENKTGTFITSKGKRWESDIDFKYSDHDVVRKNEINTYYAKDAMRIGVNHKDENKFIYDVSNNENRGYGKAFGAYDYYNQKNNETLRLPTEKPQNQIYELSAWDKEEAGVVNHNQSYIMTLEKQDAYYIGQATINIWLEGWDPDAFDAILNDHVMIQLEFITARKATNS